MEQQDSIKNCVMTLNSINFQIAELARIKEELEARVCALLEHGDDHSKTYISDKFKVTVKTGYIYSLDKDEFEMIGSRLPLQFNPVVKKTSYHIDRSIVKDAERFASKDDLNLLATIISKKPSKLHVSIRAAV